MRKVPRVNVVSTTKCRLQKSFHGGAVLPTCVFNSDRSSPFIRTVVLCSGVKWCNASETNSTICCSSFSIFWPTTFPAMAAASSIVATCNSCSEFWRRSSKSFIASLICRSRSPSDSSGAIVPSCTGCVGDAGEDSRSVCGPAAFDADTVADTDPGGVRDGEMVIGTSVTMRRIGRSGCITCSNNVAKLRP